MQAALPFEETESRAAPLRVVVLGSGSGGNAVVVESDGVRILLDAGFSCREIERRMKVVGIEPSSIAALVLTHEHEDHIRGAGRFALRHRIPVWATSGTLNGFEVPPDVMGRVELLESGRCVEIAGFSVEPFAIPHDAREPVGFVVEDSAAAGGSGSSPTSAAGAGSPGGGCATSTSCCSRPTTISTCCATGRIRGTSSSAWPAATGTCRTADAADGLPELLERPTALGRALPPLADQQPAGARARPTVGGRSRPGRGARRRS